MFYGYYLSHISHTETKLTRMQQRTRRLIIQWDVFFPKTVWIWSTGAHESLSYHRGVAGKPDLTLQRMTQLQRIVVVKQRDNKGASCVPGLNLSFWKPLLLCLHVLATLPVRFLPHSILCQVNWNVHSAPSRCDFFFFFFSHPMC